ncbi:MAG: hypothetical protein JNL52_09795 [Flavobacteriales bacterium]|nr:hypothetical protein [Flavobacteriales bacterium]
MNLTTVHSLWLAPLCLLLGGALAWWLYRRTSSNEGFGRPVNLLLGTLRALAIALVAFFLLEPMVRLLVREVRKPVVVVAHDGSASLMATGDTAALKNAYRTEFQELVDRLGERYEVRTFTYGQQVNEGIDFAQPDALTDVDQLFREVYDRFGGPDLGAVIIDGDGIVTRGRDPRLSATRLGIPVHAVLLGDTTVRPDLALKAVEHNRISYLDNELPLLARVDARHLVGVRTQVTVSQGERELATREVVVTGDPQLIEVPFTVKAERPGTQRYTVRIRPVAQEASVVNNAQDIYIDVLDDRQKVLLLGLAPHPDLGALRFALSGLEGYGCDLSYAAEYTGQVEEYDLVVLHQLPSTKVSVQPLLQRMAAKGIPALFIIGQGMDMAAFNAAGAAVNVSNMRTASTDAQAAMNPDFSLFTLEPAQARAIERFPPLQVPFGQYDPGRSAAVLLNQRIGAVRTQYPLLALQQQGERRLATLMGEGIWRWRLADLQQNGSTAHFDKLVHKLVQYLALKADKKRFRVDHLPVVNENEPLLFQGELYNKAYENINTPEATLTLTDEEGRDYPFTFSRAGANYRLDAGRLPAGTYTWKATTTLDGERLSDKGEVVVRELMAERVNTVADHMLWRDIAARTEGSVVAPGSLVDLEKQLEQRKDLVARSYAHASFSDLIGVRWLFFLILALLTVEWVVRRRNGSY